MDQIYGAYDHGPGIGRHKGVEAAVFRIEFELDVRGYRKRCLNGF